MEEHEKYGRLGRFRIGDEVEIICDCSKGNEITFEPEGPCKVPFNQKGMIGTIDGVGNDKLPVIVVIDIRNNPNLIGRTRWYHKISCLRKTEEIGFDPEDIISKATGVNNVKI